MKRIISLVSAAAVACAAVITPWAYADTSAVTISTPDEMREFLKNCTADEFSKGRTFIIANDIDMSSEEAAGGEIFCGTLKGEGHKISNLNLSFKGTNGGLFVRIGEEGQVRDLNISGNYVQEDVSEDGISSDKIVGGIVKNAGISGISPNETTGITGGVAAVNEGLIVDCAFEGSVDGKKTTGGIAGINGDSGVIDACANGGGINGIEQTGGIAGENSGRIKNSSNYGIINPKAEETTKECGGIAGFSSGVIENCRNNGAVGCEGYGSGIGGIAGKQSGVISECENKGAVSGKINTGGIAGMFVPFTDIDVTMDNIKSQIEKDKEDIEKEIDDIHDGIKDKAGELTDGLNIFKNGGSGSEGVDGVLSSLSAYIDSAAQNRKSSSEASNNLKESIGEAVSEMGDSLSEGSGSLSGAISDIGDSLSESADSLSGSLSRGTDALTEIAGSVSGAIDDASADTELEDQVVSSLRNFDENIGSLSSALQSSVDASARMKDDMSELNSSLSDFLDNASINGSQVSSALTDMLYDVDINTDALNDLTYSARIAADRLDDILYEIEDGVSDITYRLRAPIRELEKLLREIEKDAEERKQRLEALKQKLAELKEKIENWEGIGGLPTIPPLNRDGKNALGKLRDLVFTPVYAEENGGLTLDEILDTDRIKEELKKIISVDVSLDRSVAGEYADNALIEKCINTGAVRGNQNIGGIAGNMGVESLVRKGDTVTLPNGKTVVSDMAVKAVIKSCINDSEVYAKSKYAGGIAGSSNVGIIKSCLGAGSITAENDGYAGGIGGSVMSSVLFSVGAAELSGKGDLGGIAGKGDIIRECYSIASFKGEAQRIGMIAGSAEGEVKNNCFIREETGGIGGASYETNAQPIEFEDMKCGDALPEKMDMFFNDDWVCESGCFPQIKALAQTDAAYIADDIRALSAKYARTVFTVNFIEDNEVIKTLVKNYGEVIGEDEIPQLEGKDGRYPHWDRDTAAPIRRHTDFRAIYDNAVMTIASKEEPPILLAEGNFSDNTVIEVRPAEVTADFDGYKKLSAYGFSISPAKDAAHGFKLHILNKDGKGMAIGIADGGEAKVIECERDGSYLVCYLENTADFVILEKESGGAYWILFLAAAVLLAAGSAWFVIRRRVKNKERNIAVGKAEQHENTEEKEEQHNIVT